MGPEMLPLQANDADYEYEVTCSYCEVYNELIFDLLIPNSGPLYLRCGFLLEYEYIRIKCPPLPLIEPCCGFASTGSTL